MEKKAWRGLWVKSAFAAISGLVVVAAGCPMAETSSDTTYQQEEESAREQPVVEAATLDVEVVGPGSVSQETAGRVVTVTAFPDPGCIFDGWSGTTFCERNPLTIRVTDSTSLTAHFCELVLDTDADGVRDSADECPDTPRDEEADGDNGCSCSQLDDDDDRIHNCDDQCPDTPADERANDHGCSCSQLDDDEDGLSNCRDMCPLTPLGTVDVNEDGCGPAERDTDNDGVRDHLDECPHTPFGSHVNDEGCPPVCGNDIVEYGEECEPPDTDTCDANCQKIVPVCGNSVVEYGEECEPPNTDTCDADCRSISIAVCGNHAIEAGEECDPPDGTTCGDDCRIIEEGPGSCFTANTTPGCDDQACSDVVCCFDSACCTEVWGQSCAEDASVLCSSGVCAGGTGSCLSAHAMPGCGDEPCCNMVCFLDPYCCGVEWDGDCAFLAVSIAAQTSGCLCAD